MPVPSLVKRRVSADLLSKVIHQAFRASGLSTQHCEFMVNSLINASLRGIDSHGICLTPIYIDELSRGRAKVNPDLSIKSSHHAVIRMDAADALGMVSSHVATEHVIQRAKTCGIAAIAVANSNHFGAASIYSLKIAQAGYIGLSFSHTGALVAPFNGFKRMFGTNPISFAAPGSHDEIFCLDMASSHVSFSKVRQCLERGEALSPDWVVDVNETELNEIVLKPLGGYKGQGLGMMIQILSGLLTGMMFDHQMAQLYDSDCNKPRKVGHFIVAMDISAFTDKDVFMGRLTELMRTLRQSPALPQKTIFAPGDLESQQTAVRLKEGIELDQKLYDYFAALAKTHNIQFSD